MRRTARVSSALAATLAVALLAAGCDQSASGPATEAATGSEAEGRPGASGVPAKSPAESAPSLPPGDPGLDAPAAPDPGAVGAGEHAHERARRAVPAGAMLTAGTVRMVLGGSWERHAAEGDECVRPAKALGTSTMSYRGSAAGLVVETVATYEDAEAADAAVAALSRSAAACGWTSGPDPRLGSASVAATDGTRSMAGVSAEGVVTVLVGKGELTGDAIGWGSLVDLALGTSCAAAADGCH